MNRNLCLLLGGWLVLAGIFIGLGRQNLAAPGLYYDEAVFGGLAKDFLTQHSPAGHLPGTSTWNLRGHPFPLFVQPHLGALKCWTLIPAFQLFGGSMAVQRGTNVFFGVVILLVLMLWTRWLLGLAEALLAGALLVADPAFFFGTVLDWSGSAPGLLCRIAGLFFGLAAWRTRRPLPALGSGLCFGIAFFNRADFGVALAGIALAAVVAGGRSLGPVFREQHRLFWGFVGGFALAAGPALVRLGGLGPTAGLPGVWLNPAEYAEKCGAWRHACDGSYFYRLMEAGGRFDALGGSPAPVWSPFGIVVLLAAAFLLWDAARSPAEDAFRATRSFLLLATALICLGVLLLPGAVDISQVTLVYPFPHLLIALAVTAAWRRNRGRARRAWPALAGAAVVPALLLLGGGWALARTERFISQSGGRGWWSSQLNAFAAQYQTRTNVAVVSLDWGFNEQLRFLTDGPRLGEPFWRISPASKPDLPRVPGCVYLAHPPAFSRSPLGQQLLEAVAQDGTNAMVRPWRDGLGTVAFYSISFERE